MQPTPPYIVLTSDGDVPAFDLDEAVAVASDSIDGPEPVNILDGDGRSLFDPAELVERVIAYRSKRSG